MDYNLLQLFGKGGWLMWPLLLCSVTAIAIIIERTLFFFRHRYDKESFVDQLVAIIQKKDSIGALRFCRDQEHVLGYTGAYYLDNLEYDARVRQDVIRREGSVMLDRIEGRLRWLSAVAHLAPMIGLLGTVTGMVVAFAQIHAMAGAAGPAALAGGIWTALLTTVFGLVIAIPSLAAYHWFEGRADRTARDMQYIVSVLDEWYGKTTFAPSGSAEPGFAESELEAMHF
ncbi:MAG: biopolymer transport protein ExbB [Pseudoalteromonas tetraodonis]|jgi:biopolymer transport protein ExbB